MNKRIHPGKKTQALAIVTQALQTVDGNSLRVGFVAAIQLSETPPSSRRQDTLGRCELRERSSNYGQDG